MARLTKIYIRKKNLYRQVKKMQAYAYEGYFENGQFFVPGQTTTHIKGRKKVFITILDEPTENDDVLKKIAEFDRMVDESADELLNKEYFQRITSSRPLAIFSNDEGV